MNRMSSPNALENVLHGAHGCDRDVIVNRDLRRFVGEQRRRIALRAADERVELVDEQANPGGVARGEVAGDDEAVAEGVGEEGEGEHGGTAYCEGCAGTREGDFHGFVRRR